MRHSTYLVLMCVLGVSIAVVARVRAAPFYCGFANTCEQCYPFYIDGTAVYDCYIDEGWVWICAPGAGTCNAKAYSVQCSGTKMLGTVPHCEGVVVGNCYPWVDSCAAP